MKDIQKPRKTWWWICVALALCGGETGVTQEPPQNLPAPSSVPLPSSRAYLGPPAGIDGPEVLLPEVGADANLTLPHSVVENALPPEELVPDELVLGAPQKLSAYQSGFFQKLSLAAGWMGNSSDPADLGLTEIETFAQVGLPAPIIEWPL